ncbi:MAG TPA: LEPR-XLL domain-containing protein, partial [Sedimenticola sp.]|nr:LEPR-XLL domain-containing protein [Sedimenticola sp.]
MNAKQHSALPSAGQQGFVWEALEPRLLLSADSLGALLGDGVVQGLLDREQDGGMALDPAALSELLALAL